MTLPYVPFQCSMNAPTTHASFAEAAVTPSRTSNTLVGLGTLVQLVPSQCSMSGTVPVWVYSYPAAQIWFVPGTRVTAFSWSSPPELRDTFQLVPFQCSISG